MAAGVLVPYSDEPYGLARLERNEPGNLNQDGVFRWLGVSARPADHHLAAEDVRRVPSLGRPARAGVDHRLRQHAVRHGPTVLVPTDLLDTIHREHDGAVRYRRAARVEHADPQRQRL